MVTLPSPRRQIKVAVQADRNCVRSYRPQAESRNFNTLSLVLKTSSPDNLLFFQGSNTSVRQALGCLHSHARRRRFLHPVLMDRLFPRRVSRLTSWPWRRIVGRCLCCGIWVQEAPDWSFPDWTSPTTDGQESTPRGKNATSSSRRFNLKPGVKNTHV